MSKIRVGVVHTFLYSVEDLKAQFREQLPEAEMINIIDDSLLEEALANGAVTPAIISRMCDYYQNLQELGCVCALNQCSSVGEASDIAGKTVSMPIFKIDRPMARKAAELGEKIAVIATACSTVEPSSRLVVGDDGVLLVGGIIGHGELHGEVGGAAAAHIHGLNLALLEDLAQHGGVAVDVGDQRVVLAAARDDLQCQGRPRHGAEEVGQHLCGEARRTDRQGHSDG